MQQHRDAAQNAAAHRKLKFESKMAHVQNILASVQVITDRTRELSIPLQQRLLCHLGSFVFYIC